MATPAIEAKAYAESHGFIIEPNGRRYDVARGNVHIANVGGYLAALNAMKRNVELRACEVSTEWPVKSDVEIINDIHEFVAQLDRDSKDILTLQTGRGVELDALGQRWHREPRRGTETDVSYRAYLMYGVRPSDGGAVKDRIRARKPYFVSILFDDGSGVNDRFATRPDALKFVRRCLSGPDGKRVTYQNIYYNGV